VDYGDSGGGSVIVYRAAVTGQQVLLRWWLRDFARPKTVLTTPKGIWNCCRLGPNESSLWANDSESSKVFTKRTLDL
jgi:hypothetical protein